METNSDKIHQYEDVNIVFGDETLVFSKKVKCAYLWELLSFMENELEFALSNMHFSYNTSISIQDVDRLLIEPLLDFENKHDTEYELSIVHYHHNLDKTSTKEFTIKGYGESPKYHLGSFEFGDTIQSTDIYGFLKCTLIPRLRNYIIFEETKPINNTTCGGFRISFKVQYETYSYFYFKLNLFLTKYNKDLTEEEIFKILEGNSPEHFCYYKFDVDTNSITNEKLIRFYDVVPINGKPEKYYQPITLKITYDEDGNVNTNAFRQNFIKELKKLKEYYQIDHVFKTLMNHHF